MEKLMSSGQEAIRDIPLTRRARLVDYLGLERNVSIASAAVFLTAGIIGLIGTLVFAMSVEERYAS